MAKNLIPVSFLFFLSCAYAAELPDAFPSDIPVADFMEVTNTMQVRDELMVDFHAPGQSMMGVVEWLTAALTEAGWQNTSQGGTARSQILVFTKGDRRCGIMVTNFVMSPSMQMDESIKGIQMQISGGSKPAQDSAATSADAVAAEEDD